MSEQELRDRWAQKCPACGDLDGQHIKGCRFSPPYGTFDDMRHYYEAQALAIRNGTTSVVQRVAGEPCRPDPAPDYVVVAQIISLHHRGRGDKPELIEETELSEVARYTRLPDALEHAERITSTIRLIGACDRCSGSGKLGPDGDIITCPDCNGEGR